MMLKTSSRNINPFVQMIKHTLKKNLGIIILLCIAAILYCPGTFLIEIERNIDIYGAKGYVNNYMFENLMAVVAVCAGIIVTLLNFMNFSFLYQKRSSDVFHAFPLTRTELLLSRMISGIVITFIPVIICYSAFGIMSAIFPWMIRSVWTLVFAFINTLLIVLVCSSFSMIFVVCSGSVFDLIVSFVGANGALLIIAVIVNLILEESLIGYDSYLTSDIMKNLSPLYSCGMGLTHIDDTLRFSVSKQNIWFIIRFIVYIIAFTAASILLYKKRKAEKGGQAYAYKFIYIFCSILAGVCGGYLLGMLFAQGEFNLIFWIFTVIGALITCVVYGAVTNRGFKEVKRSLIYGAISSAVMPIIAVVAITGCFGFTNRVPKAEKIKTAYIRCFGEDIKFDDPKEVTDLHKELLSSGAVVREENYLGGQMRWIYFDYTFEDGSQMTRRFHLIESKAVDILFKVYQSPERITNITDALEEMDSSVIDIDINAHTEEDAFGGYLDAYLTRAETFTLLEHYKKDLEKANRSYVTNEAEYNFSLNFYDESGSSYYFCLEFSKKFENTYNYLTSLDLSAREAELQYKEY